MQTFKTGVSVDSWHYHYYVSLKRLWNLPVPLRTSLCPYVQSMIWLTVLGVVLAPLAAVGYTLSRIHRGAMEVLALVLNPALVSLGSRRFEKSALYGWGRRKPPTGPQTTPALVWYATIPLTMCAVGVLVAAAVALISYGVWNALLWLPNLPAFLWWGVLQFGEALYIVLGDGLGAILHALAHGAGDLWVIALAFLSDPWIWRVVLKGAVWTTSVLAVGALLGFAALRLLHSHLGQQAIESWEASRNHQPTPRDDDERPRRRRRSGLIQRCLGKPLTSLLRPVGKLLAKLRRELFGWRGVHNEQKIHVVGILPMLWAFGVALKKRACPLVEFVREGEVSQDGPRCLVDTWGYVLDDRGLETKLTVGGRITSKISLIRNIAGRLIVRTYDDDDGHVLSQADQNAIHGLYIRCSFGYVHMKDFHTGYFVSEADSLRRGDFLIVRRDGSVVIARKRGTWLPAPDELTKEVLDQLEQFHPDWFEFLGLTPTPAGTTPQTALEMDHEPA